MPKSSTRYFSSSSVEEFYEVLAPAVNRQPAHRREPPRAPLTGKSAEKRHRAEQKRFFENLQIRLVRCSYSLSSWE
eukprot:3427059-Pyramimonas_sp.AAC.1